MKAREEVQQFLNRFFPKMEIWGIFFLERDKNLEALKEFGITPVEREVPNSQTLCISFHKAENKIHYAFK